VLDQLFPALPGQQSTPGGPGLSLSDPLLASSIEERIKSHEAAELSRRRKASKIHRMAKYNNLMTQGDRDFITRIQVSQLMNNQGINGNHDPYYDDFYFEVMRSLKQGRLQAVQNAQQVQAQTQQQQQGLEAGGNGVSRQGDQQQQQRGMQNQNGRMGRQGQQENKRLMTRRENAMNRMAQQVQRIVDDAKKKPRATQRESGPACSCWRTGS